MKKDIKDYLHLYLGQDVRPNEKHTEAPRVVLSGIYYAQDQAGYWPDAARCQLFTHPGENILWLRLDEFKLLLRPLSDMTEEECQHLAWFNMDSEKHLDAEARISSDEVDINVVYGDGGLMVDGDAAVVIEISCRCFIGQLCVRTNGDLEMWDEDKDERLPIERQCENFRWLLSKGFDLFGLIEAGLAIDKTKIAA